MNIKDLAQSVKEANLTKFQLEDYYTQLSTLSADMELRFAELKKEQAMFMNECGEKTRSGAEMKWDITTQGQEMIILRGNIRACDKLRSSVKNRMYNLY